MRTLLSPFPPPTSSRPGSDRTGTADFEAQACSERFDPPFGGDRTLAAYATTKPFLTTREATAYCGFKTAGALRKAKLEGRIAPVGPTRRAAARSCGAARLSTATSAASAPANVSRWTCANASGGQRRHA